MEQKIRLGDLLVQKKVITKKQLEEALKRQKSTGHKLGKALVEMGLVDEETLLQFLSEQLNIPFIELSHFDIDHELSHRIPENLARRYQSILLQQEGKTYLVGMVDPLDIFAVDALTEVLNRPLKLAIVRESELLRTLDQEYRRHEEIIDFAEELEDELVKASQEGAEDAIRQADTAVLKLLRSLFEDAVQVGASDIHIEPSETLLRIRLRVDGVLQEQIIDEKKIAPALSQRVKLMAGLNIAEKRLPQDGRFSIKIRGLAIDVRLSIMPIQYGESIVMRLLNRGAELLNLDNMGMSEDIVNRFRRDVKHHHGIVLVTGPTGSGKTTTLYGALNEINDVGKNIMTIEDPIEYRLDRVNQVQVNSQLGLTFARVLRSSLRQDPDIILVGEIRDFETASIALRAALTGHLVLATLHTNDAESAAVRLIDMGVESYLVAATVRAVLAQRLIRKICDSCQEAYTPTAQEKSFIIQLFGEEKFSEHHFSHGAGCSQCNHTGYKGRTGIFELLEFTPKMVDALRINNSSEYMKLVAEDEEITSLLKSAYELATKGITTLDEVMRVAGGIV